MNKNELMKNMSQAYLLLSEKRKEEFSRILNRLLAVNFICGGRKRDREDYYFISENEQLFKDFLMMLDYDFHLYKADRVIYIHNLNNYNHLNLNQMQTIVLLLLRKLYFQKSQELQDTEFIHISLGELHSEIEATGIYNERLKKTDLKNIYHFLSRYNICERIGDLNEDDTRLIIYPTINYILPIQKIDEINQRIQQYKKGDHDENIANLSLTDSLFELSNLVLDTNNKSIKIFCNEFEIYKNALITGENGTGKSTILDAIQYVLTAGKCKFNKAASDIGNRTLESYIRCKTGIEGHEFVRSGDVTTYIALEFYDEKTEKYQIIGTVIDLPAGGRLNRDFFQIIDCKISDVAFIEERRVLTRKEFKKALIDHQQTGIFKDTIKEGESLFGNALGVKSKYFDLVTRALAFKAIDNVYQFIVDFLLKEDFVDIQNLRDSIKHYKVLEEKLKISKKECESLEGVVSQYDTYLDTHFQMDVLECLKEKLQEKQLQAIIDKSQKKYQKINDQLNFVQQKLTQLNQDEETYQERYRRLDV